MIAAKIVIQNGIGVGSIDTLQGAQQAASAASVATVAERSSSAATRRNPPFFAMCSNNVAANLLHFATAILLAIFGPARAAAQKEQKPAEIRRFSPSAVVPSFSFFQPAARAVGGREGEPPMGVPPLPPVHRLEGAEEIIVLLDFTEPRPMVGTVVMLDAQAFELARFEPYTRRGGGSSELLVWSARCAECGEAFETKTGARTAGPVRRCPAHAKAGKRVPGTRGRIAVQVIPA